MLRSALWVQNRNSNPQNRYMSQEQYFTVFILWLIGALNKVCYVQGHNLKHKAFDSTVTDKSYVMMVPLVWIC